MNSTSLSASSKSIGRASPTAGSADARPSMGRFQPLRILGRGAQASVWLAFDPHLEREVAIKVIHLSSAGDREAMNSWMTEARSVARLHHPNIVQVFEADSQGAQPYLVFEYVPGMTLTQYLSQRGKLPPVESVDMILGVLSALSVAHGQGIVHRDLKPSNILIDAQGKPRVMDFGIAARAAGDAASQGADGSAAPDAEREVVGTPGYLSPEAALGAAPNPSMDIFAAGLILGEMLLGRPMAKVHNLNTLLHDRSTRPVLWPDGEGGAIDDGLRTIIMRCLLLSPKERWVSSDALSEALQEWKKPQVSLPAEGPATDSTGNGTLDFLMRRMKHRSDFPALSSSIASIQRLANSDDVNLSTLCDEILQDVALTNKLLRLVNTARFAHAGGGNISTVSRAVSLVGFAGIRNMAISLVMLEHMQDKSHAAQLKEEFLRTLLAGALASDMCPQARFAEEAFVAAMFQNLGRLLCDYYFPEEAQQIRNLVAHSPLGARSEASASASVLGTTFEELGIGVAKKWGLPEVLQRCMRKPEGEPPKDISQNPSERLRWVTMAANDLADAVLQTPPAQLESKIEDLGSRYAKVVGVSPQTVVKTVEEGRRKLSEMAQAMGLSVDPKSPAQRLLRPLHDDVQDLSQELGVAPLESMVAADGTLINGLPTDATIRVAPSSQGQGAAGGPAQAGALSSELADTPAPVKAPPVVKAQQMLTSGIQDVTNALVGDFKLNEVIHIILETMQRALNLKRVIFCLRDPKTQCLIGRMGHGEGAQELAPHFKVPLLEGQDLFSVISIKGMDTYIAHALDDRLQDRLPAWWKQKVKGEAFLILPMQIKGKTFGLIYAEFPQAEVSPVKEELLSLVRTLRNQGVMAFKQISQG